MAPEFRKEEHQLQRLRVAELVRPGVRHVQRRGAGPRDLSRPARHRAACCACMNRPPHLHRPQHADAAEQLEALFRERQGHLSRLDPASVPDDVPHQPAQHAGRHLHRPRAAAIISARPSSTTRPRTPTTRRRNCAPTPISSCRTARSWRPIDEYGDSVSVQILTDLPEHGAAAGAQHDRGAGDPAARRRQEPSSTGSISASTTTTRR